MSHFTLSLQITNTHFSQTLTSHIFPKLVTKLHNQLHISHHTNQCHEQTWSQSCISHLKPHIWHLTSLTSGFVSVANVSDVTPHTHKHTHTTKKPSAIKSHIHEPTPHAPNLTSPPSIWLGTVEIHLVDTFDSTSFDPTSVGTSSESFCTSDSRNHCTYSIFDVQCDSQVSGRYLVLIHRSANHFHLCEVQAYRCSPPTLEWAVGFNSCSHGHRKIISSLTEYIIKWYWLALPLLFFFPLFSGAPSTRISSFNNCFCLLKKILIKRRTAFVVNNTFCV